MNLLLWEDKCSIMKIAYPHLSKPYMLETVYAAFFYAVRVKYEYDIYVTTLKYIQ